MVKVASGGTDSWYIIDNKRDPANVVRDLLQANSSDATVPFTTMDMLSNGFKIRNSDVAFNTNGNTYIFAAFAEAPQKFSLAR